MAVPIAAASLSARDSTVTAPLPPWIAAAVDRRTSGGVVLGADETLAPAAALGLWLTAERVAVGRPADLCLLDAPLAEVLADPSSTHVRHTVIAGHLLRPS